MLLIVVTGGAEPERRLRFHKAIVTIGRSKHNDIMLTGDQISRRHAQVELVDGRIVVADQQTGLGTYIDGRRITVAELPGRARFAIGPFEIAAHPGAADPIEIDLIAAIVDGRDDAGRLVYADWLETQGELERAEFLRLQESLVGARPEDDDFSGRTRRLRELGQRLDLAWRYDMARPGVEGCESRYQFKCPREWSSLAPTSRPDVRHCSACREEVFYCTTVAEARDRTRRGQCVVVDIVPNRHPGDLRPPPVPPPGGMIMPPPPQSFAGRTYNPPMPRLYTELEPLPLAPPRQDPPSSDDDDSSLPTTGEYERR